MALALSQRLAILSTEATGNDHQSALPLDACTFPEQITSLCWAGYASQQSPRTSDPLWLDCTFALCSTFSPVSRMSTLPCYSSFHFLPSSGALPQLEDCCILLGTSSGHLQLHAEDGQLLHRQRIHTSQAQSIQVRNAGMGETSQCLYMATKQMCASKIQVRMHACHVTIAPIALCFTTVPFAGLKPDDRSEDITITFRDAIVRLSSLSVCSLVRQQQQSRRWGETTTSSPISYNIWDLRKAGPRSAGICAGLKPPSLYGSLTGRDTNHKLLLVTSGR